MHQHPRPPPASASPAASEQTNPTRTNNPRDRDVQALRTDSPLTQGSGSSEDFAAARQEQPADNTAGQMQRLNQVVQNFHTKAALIILHSRVELSPAYSQKTDSKRVNRWFNLDVEETEDYKDHIKRWKTCDVEGNRPAPLVIEIFLTTEPLQQGQRLVIVDEDGKRWDVQNTLSAAHNTSHSSQRRSTDANEILLERWTIELGDANGPMPSDLATLLPLVYKKSIVLFRSLYTYSNFLPAWKLARKVGKGRAHMALKLGYRLVDGSRLRNQSRSDNLNLRLFDSNSDVVLLYDFGLTDSPAGPFSVKVEYRQHCDFRIDDSEELLSSRFLGADDELFRPSLPADRTSRTELGSLPNDRRQNLLERPELGLAYGSLSTFHQAGIGTGTSPISALRNAQDFNASSPPTPESPRPAHAHAVSQSSRNSLRAVAANRRSSFSVQPFKTPTLSASPLGSSPLASSPRAHVVRPPALGSLTEERIPTSTATAAAVAGRRTGSLVSEHAVASSASSSPKPAPTRYSSSFSHRRARLSSGGTTVRTDDDQNSSGRASASSSAQPGSGLMTEAATGGGSSGSVAEDDGENISDFLKMLELQKDLLGSVSSATVEANTRRTAAALNRFHRLRDSNTALSESMSSSMMLQRSSASSSRQLSGVPPMVAATSVSTSSSPGKPISPHTPHTPFAPSRLSAAYSHDDTDPTHLTVEETPSPSDAATEETAQGRSTANVPAIDIPNSPRPFLPGYQRSSSAQRRPLSSDEDIADLYGMRSHSMGADRRNNRPESGPQEEGDESANAEHRPRTNSSRALDRGSQVHRHSGLATVVTDGGASEPSSNRSSVTAHRSRGTRGGLVRPIPAAQGSGSSFGGTAGSAEHVDSSTSDSWGRGGRRSGSRPESKFDEDEFLPFAMERSDFNTTGRSDPPGASER
ncbi:autophagy protein 13 [Knufia peltigerae]|uniref:Autophagy-related protein 13 n=1 Tax=Knufia peltigerae TaxID=1002370 RepID=A0AA38XY87_9EURO|nr:autophagy protein 13 [Knufia peltigerae]